MLKCSIVQHSAASTCRFRNEHSEVSKCEKGNHVVCSPSSNHAFETTDSTVFVRPGLRRSASLQYSDEAWKSMLRPLSPLSSTAGTAALDQQCHSPIRVLPPSHGKPQWLHRSLFMLGQSHSLPSRSNIKPWHTGRRMTRGVCSLPNAIAANGGLIMIRRRPRVSPLIGADPRPPPRSPKWDNRRLLRYEPASQSLLYPE